MNETDKPNPFADAGQPAKPETLALLLKKDTYRNRFEQVLGERAPQFISSVLSLQGKLRDVEPRSVLAAAVIAASLDLPVDPNLGYAWIVPYKRDGRKFAQFQMGYKGYVQLALRTGSYAGMNAKAINKEAFIGYDKIGRPRIDWEKVDETLPAAGYAFGWLLTNSEEPWLFYWPKEKVEAHARRYSQAYRGGFETPWKTNFDSMALKTVVANELRHWGLLSVQMQGAFANDQSIHRDVDSEVEFPETADATSEIKRPVFDGAQTSDDEQAEAKAGLAPAQPQQTPAETPQPKRRGRKAAAEAPAQAPAPPPPAQPVNTAQPEAAAPLPRTSSGNPLVDQVFVLLDHDKINEVEVLEILKRRKMAHPDWQTLLEVPDKTLREEVVDRWNIMSAQARMDRKTKATAK